MKNIIVPTDFSATAENALIYACELNKILKAKILLFHAYFVPVLAGDAPIMPITNQEMKEGALSSLKRKRMDYEEKYPGMEFGIEAAMGMADDEIVMSAKRHNIDFIIMGTHGATGLGEFIMGTNTAKVIDGAKCPVFAIPEDAHFNGLKNIVFSANYGNHNYDHMHMIIELAKLFDAEITLLHVSSDDMEGPFEDLEIGKFKERITRESNYSKITYRLLDGKDVYHGINNYVEQYKPDLIAISMRNRSLIERIFSRSLTKRMAYHSHIPILALHIPNG